MTEARLPTVVAVIVAYNRRELLAESLAALLRQSRPVERIVVVDNASDDDSSSVARRMVPSADVLTLSRNTGGAGGFCAGIAHALSVHEADLVWVMDDDTIPREHALERMLEMRARVPSARLFASRVEWVDGRPHPMNTPRPAPLASRRSRQVAAAVGGTPLRSASFVSVLLTSESIRSKGLPIADYFLWNDDFEFTTRLIRGGYGILCPASVVEHRTTYFGSTSADPGDRFYYEVRNKIWLFSRSTSLAWSEKPVYIAASLRRWAQTFAGSSDRPRLFRALARGARAGISAPRSNEAVFEADPEVAGLVASWDRDMHD